MGKIIAVANQKGGVAKTTTTHNIGAALAEQGKRVLLVDTDGQCSLTIAVGFEPWEIEKNIYTAFQREGYPIRECITNIKPGLDIITADIGLISLEIKLVSRNLRETILSRLLEPVRDEYDYILIDCPPQLLIYTINALTCADYVLIPCKTDYLSYRGLTMLTENIEGIRSLLNPKLEVLGVVATMHMPRVKDDQQILKALRKDYNVLGVTKFLVAARKGLYGGQSTVEFDRRGDLARSYMSIAKKIIEIGG